MTVRGGVEFANRIAWIPFHMAAILYGFAYALPLQQRTLLLTIVGMFSQFRDAKEKTGEAWESLFLIVLLIRLATYQFDTVLLPMNSRLFDGCCISYNDFFNNNSGPNGTSVVDYVASMKTPETLPHIVVYFPSHAQFETYDVIVAAYDEEGTRSLFGYQLKEGKKCPVQEPDSKFQKSFCIRGCPAQEENSLHQWTLLSESQIELFFGESGRHWIPSCWDKLQSEKS
jgi:hypothetical protein